MFKVNTRYDTEDGLHSFKHQGEVLILNFGKYNMYIGRSTTCFEQKFYIAHH